MIVDRRHSDCNGRMRWDHLFADLEAQAAALEVAERAVEVGERTRIEVAALSVGERLRAAIGKPVGIRIAGDLHLRGALARVGPDWLLLGEAAGRESLVALPAVRSVAGLGRLSAPVGSLGAVAARLTLRSALRGIARDRSPVRLHLVDGTVRDATLDRVGADFVEAALHAPGEPRRRGAVREIQLITFSAVAAVRRGAG